MLLKFKTKDKARICADGSVNPAHAGSFGELITGATVGKYYELSKQGRIFTAATQTPGFFPAFPRAAIGTLAIFNPPNSGVNVAILAGVITVTTLLTSAGPFNPTWVAVDNPTIELPTITTIVSAQPCLLGAGYTSAVRVMVNANTIVSPNVIRVFPFAYSNVVTTSTASGSLSQVDKVDGAICLAPGTTVVLQSFAPAANVQGLCSVTWAEIPY